MTLPGLAFLAFVALLACTSGASAPKVDHPPAGSDSPPRSPAMDMTKKPDQGGGAFVRGASVTPADQLIAWFEQQNRNGEPRLTRVPLVLDKGQAGFSTRGARIGALEVFANDAALGMGLADRARTKCKGADQCAFWVEGYWRGKAEGSYQFDVTKVGDPIAVTELAAASFVEVEGESGN